MQKFPKEQENTKQMLLLNKNIFITSIIFSLALVSKAGAGLYGHTSANPETYEETFLNQETPPMHILNYREKMRENLLMMIEYAHSQNPNFQIIPHEGSKLLVKSFWERNLDDYNRVRPVGLNVDDQTFLTPKDNNQEPPMETLAYKYLNSVNAIALNNIYCGKKHVPLIIENRNIPVIAVEKCPTPEKFDRAIINSIMDKRLLYGYNDITYAFNDIKNQPVINESAKNVMTLSDVKNILILNDDRNFKNKNEFLKALRDTSYDLIIINPLFHHHQPFTADEINSLKFKKNGTKRLLIAEMNVSETTPSDYFWKKEWEKKLPEWIRRRSFVEENSYITEYWHPTWKEIISRHFKDIIRSNFDGVFFTGIENYQYFEKQTPIE